MKNLETIIDEFVGEEKETQNKSPVTQVWIQAQNEYKRRLKSRKQELIEGIIQNLTQGLTVMKIGNNEGYLPEDVAKRIKELTDK